MILSSAEKENRIITGSFYTPRIWVKKAQEYLKSALGETWQDDYYIWDCAAGTGNLLVGLTRPERIFASTIDLSDIILMKRLVNADEDTDGDKLELLPNHIFQFDFLNDDFSLLPENLQKIIKEEPEKLVIFINPPYAEAASHFETTGTGKTKSEVSNTTKIHEKYMPILQKSIRELFAQFFIRIYKEIPNCVLAGFSKLKYINSANFIHFRNNFKAELLKGFACPSYTFDNVQGKFPIGFLIWDLKVQKNIEKVILDVFDEKEILQGKKSFYAENKKEKSINQWLKKFVDNNNKNILYGICTIGLDFQQNKYCHMNFFEMVKVGNAKGIARFGITKNNLIVSFVYLSVRLTIPSTWINDRDQFLTPNEKWERDIEFQNNCFVYALFHSQNRISNQDGINHLIPFTEKEIHAKRAFDSHFLLDFMAGKIKADENENKLLEEKSFIPNAPMVFSNEAQNVLAAAREIYRHYHKIAGDEKQAWKINENAEYLPNAAFYDIKEFFQGRKNGRMNPKSKDEHYTELLADLNAAQKALAAKIEPKIYEYGFLLE